MTIVRFEFRDACAIAMNIDCNSSDINAPFGLHILRPYKKASVFDHIYRKYYNNHHTVELLNRMLLFELLVDLEGNMRLIYFKNMSILSEYIHSIFVETDMSNRNSLKVPSSSLFDLLLTRIPSMQFGVQFEL